MQRIVISIILGAMLVGSAALAGDDISRLGLGIHREPVDPGNQAVGPADVLIASSTNGGQFTNLAPVYEPALLAAGVGSVSSIEDAADAPFPFPTPMTSAEFGCLVVLTNDNWWGPASTNDPEANVSATDDLAIAAYLDTGGTILFSAQDYLFARGMSGDFFTGVYLGIITHIDDVNFGDTDIDYVGSPGGAIDGQVGSLHAEPGPIIGPCFIDNPFFTDDVLGAGAGFATFISSPSGTTGEMGVTWDAGLWKSVFTTADMACTDNAAQFQDAVNAIIGFLGCGAATPVEETSWGSIKSEFK